MDPAWFYSSLAQAAAAVVGLIGAILGNRLVEHLHAMRSKRRELESKIRPIQAEVSLQMQGWRNGEVSLRGQLGEVESRLGKVNAPGSQALDRDRPRMLQELEVRKSELEKGIQPLQEILEVLPILEGEIKDLNLDHVQDRIEALPNDHLHRTEALRILRKLLPLEEEIGRFRDGLLPRWFWLVFVLLAWIAATGIVLPLAALLGTTHILISYKSFLLAAFVLGLAGLVVYFAYVLKEVRNLRQLTWN